MKEKDFPTFKTRDGQIFHPDDQGKYFVHPAGFLSLVDFTIWAKNQRLEITITRR